MVRKKGFLSRKGNISNNLVLFLFLERHMYYSSIRQNPKELLPRVAGHLSSQNPLEALAF